MPPRENKILTLINPDEVIRLAQDLIRIPSITGKEGKEISQFIADWFASYGLDPQLLEVGKDRYDVACVLQGRKKGPRLLLQGHQDTKWVNGMEIDPFKAEIKDGKLFGRGACDMKSALAAMMLVFKVFKENRIPFKGSLVFASEVGEEGGGSGASLLEKHGFLDADMAIVGEPSGLRVEIGNRGSYTNVIKILGVATHSGTADKGINAIEKMAKVVQKLYHLPCFQEVDSIWGRVFPNVWKIQGGGRWEASVADECSIWLDIRTTPMVSSQQVDKEIFELLERLQTKDPDFKIDTDVTHSRKGGEAIHISPNEEIVKVAQRAVSRILGKKAQIGACAGATMAAGLISRGIPAIILGPGNLEQAHSANEWVEIDQVVAAAKIYTLIAWEILALKEGIRYERSKKLSRGEAGK